MHMQGLVSVLTQQLETERKDSHSLSAACDAAKAQVEELKAKLAGVLQCVAVCYSVLQTKSPCLTDALLQRQKSRISRHNSRVCCSVVQCGAVWCSVVQCVVVALCYSVLQCVALPPRQCVWWRSVCHSVCGSGL